MKGHPVTIRTIDPPIHSTAEDLMVELAVLKALGNKEKEKSENLRNC